MTKCEFCDKLFDGESYKKELRDKANHLEDEHLLIVRRIFEGDDLVKIEVLK